MKVKVPWCKNEEEFITSISDGEWVITKELELIHVGLNDEKPDHVKHEFSIYGLSSNHTTDWLRFFCEEHHSEVDFDKEFRTNEPGVFAKYQEKFGYDYEEWISQEIYKRLKGELARRGYEISW
ncbi:MAG: hypothetical protein H6Q53_2163 [Deltaproteobacteria bacterium]|jgi:hypothetical protein|nr:hypothetical protein [Deltaproteobacteria bacterium]